MDLEDSEGMHRDRMESIIGLLLYVTRTYRDINLYFKELVLTLDSCIPYRDKEGWGLRGGILRCLNLMVNGRG